MRYLITSAVLALSGLATIAQAGPETWTTGPFDMPESAIHDAARDRIVLSLIGGHPGAADGNGALALLSPKGDILDPAWVTGLDAPKGMAIVGSTLLVADLTRLHEIDLPSGTLIRSLDVDGAVFLNDLTSDGQQAFVSDFMTNRIWRYEAGQLSLWMDDANLNHPNGLLLESDRLLVGSWGAGMRDDFSTEEPGSLLSINLADKTISVVAARIGNIDGVVKLGTHLLVNDWITGHLMKIDADGTARTVAKHAPGLADIATMGDSLLLPSMLEGTLSAQPYP